MWGLCDAAGSERVEFLSGWGQVDRAAPGEPIPSQQVEGRTGTQVDRLIPFYPNHKPAERMIRLLRLLSGRYR